MAKKTTLADAQKSLAAVGRSGGQVFRSIALMAADSVLRTVENAAGSGKAAVRQAAAPKKRRAKKRTAKKATRKAAVKAAKKTAKKTVKRAAKKTKRLAKRPWPKRVRRPKVPLKNAKHPSAVHDNRPCVAGLRAGFLFVYFHTPISPATAASR